MDHAAPCGDGAAVRLSGTGERGGMDAYDQDSKAPHGPDGSRGARRPGTSDAAGEAREDGESLETGEVDRANDAGEAREAAADEADGADEPRQTDDPGPSDSPEAPGPHFPAPSIAPPPDPVPPIPVTPAPPRTGVAALSPRYQIGAALALAVVAVVACVHLGMVFLHVAPANTVTKQHGKAIDEWIYPEFEQNWKLFAPNPLQQDIAVQVRAQVALSDGSMTTTGWYDLSALDGADIKGNPLPSHTEQNELRRAWDFFTATHDAENRPVGLRGSLSEQYLRRIVVMRLYREDPASREGTVQSVQVRSETTNVPPPEWSHEQVSDKPVYRVLPWWTVTDDEAARGVK
ncbi:DUF5819 family protein [Streptomyces sp. NPDC050625]|uniref:DUF5819 family protein n=1 Tax=Streptomyces sp. NPDC050625 TaxID=3154629 RepID=UPI003426B64E